MLITLLSWLVALFVFFILGFTGKKFIGKFLKYELTSLESILITGIVLATLYAETFSLFYKVSALAFYMLLVLSLFALYVFKDSIAGYVNERVKPFFIFQNSTHKIYFWTIGCALIGFAALASSQTAIGYDTYLYHAQSIRWLEEYGIVKGLGNLHTRFAFNSSFLCLQALFSFPWLTDLSLHSLNGLLWLFFVVFCIRTFQFDKKQIITLSNLLRILFLTILFRPVLLRIMSSPNTDFMPTCLTAFIFIKWCDLNEREETNYVPYELLAVLGLFSMSVKLSAASVALFALKPLIAILRKKDYVAFFKFTFLETAAILPFIARNILLSGYLFYPVPSLDFFNFDWKIPHATAVAENIIIKVFARAWGTGYSMSDYDRSFFEWFKLWQEKAGNDVRILTMASFGLCFVAAVIIILMLLKKIECRYDKTLLFISIFGFLFLMFTAPSVRFGIWWLYILPIIALWKFVDVVGLKFDFNAGRMKFALTLLLFCMLGAVGVWCTTFSKLRWTVQMWAPEDYMRADCAYLEIKGQKFYYPSPTSSGMDSDQAGYHSFPASPSESILKQLEMRGATLKEGFRVKARDI